VLSRASGWARAGALLAATLLAIWIVTSIGPSTRFVVVWMALVAATYLVVLRIVRRIAFEVIRSRDNPPTDE
jgi:hypothetical protein